MVFYAAKVIKLFIVENKKALISIINFKGLSGAVNYVNETAQVIKSKYGLEIDVLTARKDRKAYPFKVRTAFLVKNLRGEFKRRAFSWYCGFISSGYGLINGHGELLNQDVLTLHNLIHLTYEKFSKKPDGLWKFHDRMLSSGNFKILIANSQFMKKDLVSRFSIPEEKIRVVYPSYNSSVFTDPPYKQEAKKTLGISPSSFCFLLPASGDFAKRGVDRFLKIFSEILTVEKNCQALITGKDPNTTLYMEKIKASGLEGKVSIIQPRKDVKTIYACADCVLYPAVLEEFGISLTEAMACSIPVLCSPEIGACELMESRARSFSVCSSNEEFISRALSLISGKVSDDIFMENAIAVRKRTWEKTASEIYEVYREILSANSIVMNKSK